jgi:choline dehydrogenase-like flavoprotein
MKFIDINALPAGTTVTADICIVGAGAAGIAIASELDGSPQTVSLIESGDFGPDEDTQSLYDVEIAGHPTREKFMSRARYFGGTCNLWAGRTMRLNPMDLARRDWIPHSGWPIPYEELERYYPRADEVLRLPAKHTVDAAVSRGRMGRVERAVFEHPDLQPVVATWARKPLRFGAVYRRQLQRSRNVSVYLNANVTDIQLNESGSRVEHCTAVSLGGATVRLRARRFVLATGGLETARLLLASRSVHRSGIGNEFDTVGRYYMDHPRAVFGTVRFSEPQKLPLLTGVPMRDGVAQVGIRFSEAVQQRERLLNNYLTLERHWSDQAAQAYQSIVRSMKILLRKGYAGRRSLSRAELATIPELIYLLAPRELLPHAVYSSARKLRQRLGKGLRELIVVNYCEQMPNPQSRVYLGEKRDRLNMPVLVLDWKIGRGETDGLMRLHALLDASLRRHGLGELDNTSERFTDRMYRDASHHLGTARMSTSPRDGVVDERCAVHGVGNLFVAGSAVFPTSGHANPTLTIVALAIRLAEHLKRETTCA